MCTLVMPPRTGAVTNLPRMCVGFMRAAGCGEGTRSPSWVGDFFWGAAPFVPATGGEGGGEGTTLPESARAPSLLAGVICPPGGFHLPSLPFPFGSPAMGRTRRALCPRRDAFTLVELLVVIA